MLDGLGRIIEKADKNASSGWPPFLIAQKRVLARTSNWASGRLLTSANIRYDGRVFRRQFLDVKMPNCTST
jgi:hypothetical protein